MNVIIPFWKNVRNNLLKRTAPTVTLISLVGIVLYFPILFHYFQADEWYFFGKILAAGECGVWCLIRPSGFHFIPFSSMLVYAFFTLFHTNALPYAFFSYVLHIVNSVLIYVAIRKIGNKSGALLASIFFLSFAQANQSVTWFAAAFAVLPAAFFLLLSLIFYIYSFGGSRVMHITAYVMLVISLFFKEDAVGLFPIFFFYDLFRNRDRIRLVHGLVVIGVYLIIRFVVAGSLNATPIPIHNPAFAFSYQQVIRNVIVMPLSLLSSLIFREQDILSLGKIIGNTISTLFMIPPEVIRNHDIFNENIAYNYLAPILGFIVCITLKPLMRLSKTSFGTVLLVAMLLTVPYVFLPQGFRLESRHYYMFGIALSGILARIYTVWKKTSRRALGIFICILCILFLRNGIGVRQNLSHSLHLSKVMKSYVNALSQAHPSGAKKYMLVNTGDRPPLFSGVGYVAMVLYSDKRNYNEFFVRDELWNWGSEGYVEHGETAFGYYLTEDSLIRAGAIHSDVQIASIRWNNKTLEAIVEPYKSK